MTQTAVTRSAPWWRWLVLLVATAAVGVVVWVVVSEWGGVVHGHPAYAVVLGLTLVGSLLVAVRAWRGLPQRAGWRRAVGPVLLVLGVAWLAAMAWLKPMTATEPAVTAMRSDSTVTVTESPTRIVLTPRSTPDGTVVLFYPGALVDPRAYAAVLRPVADAGHTVIITKPPLGIAFLDVGAFGAARSIRPDAERWVLGGHSLGGVVAATRADGSDSDASAPTTGLFFYASYPAGDLSTSLTAAVLSISGSRDGLSTPQEVQASRADLPPTAQFTVVEGAVHAYFGDYGPQPGDGTPTISHDDARTQISGATVEFVAGQGR